MLSLSSTGLKGQSSFSLYFNKPEIMENDSILQLVNIYAHKKEPSKIVELKMIHNRYEVGASKDFKNVFAQVVSHERVSQRFKQDSFVSRVDNVFSFYRQKPSVQFNQDTKQWTLVIPSHTYIGSDQKIFMRALGIADFEIIERTFNGVKMYCLGNMSDDTVTRKFAIDGGGSWFGSILEDKDTRTENARLWKEKKPLKFHELATPTSSLHDAFISQYLLTHDDHTKLTRATENIKVAFFTLEEERTATDLVSVSDYNSSLQILSSLNSCLQELNASLGFSSDLVYAELTNANELEIIQKEEYRETQRKSINETVEKVVPTVTLVLSAHAASLLRMNMGSYDINFALNQRPTFKIKSSVILPWLQTFRDILYAHSPFLVVADGKAAPGSYITNIGPSTVMAYVQNGRVSVSTPIILSGFEQYLTIKLLRSDLQPLHFPENVTVYAHFIIKDKR